ncbi:MAG: type II toxin-antitoxin system VapC family toxin [Coriobacteriia bacterium]|nr:type II toxin-antitoxin system VapC family toxin [Coriobacteriia bacterium]
MSSREAFALDASIGVKWFMDEPGSDASRVLYRRAMDGEILLVAPTHFVHEVLSVVRREFTHRAIPEAWEDMKASGITIVPLEDQVIAEAATQCAALGCSFYDALAPACASLLGATLVSADACAHGAYPGALIIT